MIPNNIVLIFLPPYSPELNPAERMWQMFKREFANRIFTSMDDLNYWLFGLYNNVDSKTVKSITDYDYIKSYPYQTEM